MSVIHARIRTILMVIHVKLIHLILKAFIPTLFLGDTYRVVLIANLVMVEHMSNVTHVIVDFSFN